MFCMYFASLFIYDSVLAVSLTFRCTNRASSITPHTLSAQAHAQREREKMSHCLCLHPIPPPHADTHSPTLPNSTSCMLGEGRKEGRERMVKGM